MISKTYTYDKRMLNPIACPKCGTKSNERHAIKDGGFILHMCPKCAIQIKYYTLSLQYGIMFARLNDL